MERAVELVVRNPDQLGEAPTFDAAAGRLVWIDVVGRRLNTVSLDERGTPGAATSVEMELHASAVIPRASGGMLAVSRTEFVEIDAEGRRGATFASLEPSAAGMVEAGGSFNDAKCDADGRLLAGVIGPGAAGGLVRLDPDGAVEVVLTGIQMANGMGWSPDGETFYFADTGARTIHAYDFDRLTGRPSEARPFVTFAQGQGFPDGLCVDDQGCIWVAVPFMSAIQRHSPDGELLEVIRTPVVSPTSCAFGGPDGDRLFISSWQAPSGFPERLADFGLSTLVTDEQASQFAGDALGGALLACRPGVTGPPASVFMG